MCSLCLFGLSGESAYTQTVGAPGLGSPLSGLSLERRGTAMHEGSWDRNWKNGDFRRVEPGQTLTLLDYKGAGMIRRFWCTIAPDDNTIRCQAILRMYWDGEKEPSVETPIGAFFGVGFGEQQDYISLPLNETSGGYNCYWPMPFHKSAYWTITNLSAKPIDAFYYNIDYTAYKSLPASELCFHAQWRRENPTTQGKNYVILDATGKGQYVGTALYMQNMQARNITFLEGNEVVSIDGNKTPSIIGTGTEDYFSSGWYFDHGPYSAPYHGCIIKDDKIGRISAYRWHIEDAIPFKKSIQFTIQHGAEDDVKSDYSSVAYWYQTLPHKQFPPLPSPEDLLPSPPATLYKIPDAIEGESLQPSAKATSGTVETQDLSGMNGKWSGGLQLWWHGQTDGSTMTIQLPVAQSGTYDLTGYFTKAPDYGNFQLMQGENNIGPVVNCYAQEVTPTGAVDLGNVTLNAGDNTLTVKIVGKDPSSTGYLFGLDAFTLKPIQ
jgi:hypothetical protein